MNNKEPTQDKDTPIITKQMIEEGQKAKEYLEALFFGGIKEKS